jgi:hypothetical protein
MARFRQEFVDWVDSQISVDDGLFWFTDLRAMMAWPAVPFIVLIVLADPPSTAANIAFAAMILCMAWWTAFLLRRRAAKKRSWIEPKRFSDDTNGY